MKKMKQFAAMLLAFTLILTMSVTAFALPTDTGTITIHSNDTVSVDGKTFKAYKVLDATFTGITTAEGKEGVAYTVPAELADFYAARYQLNKADPSFEQSVVARIANEGDMFGFAADVLKAAKAANITPVSAVGTNGSATFSNLPFGYYVIEDQGAATPISALMLQTAGTVEVEIKAEKPSIDKVIVQENEPDSNHAAQNVGDMVDFKITSKVPAMDGYGINTHRLLVRGRRIENGGEKGKLFVPNEAIVIDPVIVTPVVAAPMLLVLLIVLLTKYRSKNKGKGKRLR